MMAANGEGGGTGGFDLLKWLSELGSTAVEKGLTVTLPELFHSQQERAAMETQARLAEARAKAEAEQRKALMYGIFGLLGVIALAYLARS